MTINIGLAFGGVLATIEESFAEYMGHRLGRTYAVEAMRTLNLNGFYGVPADRLEYERGRFMQRWFDRVKPYPQARAAIDVLRHSGLPINFYVITTMPDRTWIDLARWLDEEYDRWNPTICFTQGTLPFLTNADLLPKRAFCSHEQIDLFIESHPVRAQAVSMRDREGKGTRTILLRRPWNQYVTPLDELHVRLVAYDDWYEVLRVVQELANSPR